jgi:DNA-binding response OmpR family regulator
MTKRILIADDDLLLRELLVARLSTTGHDLDLAADGEEALVKLRRRSFDLVLLDLRMPRMDGIEVLQSMKAIPGHKATKVIVLTGSRSEDDVADAERLGVESYLAKPVDIERLAERIEMVLNPSGSKAQKTWLVEDFTNEDVVLRS